MIIFCVKLQIYTSYLINKLNFTSKFNMTDDDATGPPQMLEGLSEIYEEKFLLYIFPVSALLLSNILIVLIL